MKQVVVIGGGNTFTTYEDYLADLQATQIESIASFKKKNDWKTSLQETLGEDYEVLNPQMPNKQNAKYIEWKIWFEKIIPFLSDEVILVGHSLGASFFTRYLSENDFPKPIIGTLLVAGAYGTDMDAMTEEFKAPVSLERFKNQSNEIFLYHSTDDPIVPFSELPKYAQALPTAIPRIFEDRGHFNQETFPELVTDLKSL